MKQLFLSIVALVCCGLSSFANPGDTTWVQANNRNISHDPASTNWYGNYDTTVSFPTGNTTYRRIYMIYTLGKYVCPNGAQYCSQWDYTVQNFLMTPGGDTLEIGRFITPYAGNGDPRFPSSWTQRYIYDVTDYAALLKGSATLRMFYSGYSGGFTCNIRFAFIEGTPERNVTGVQRLWTGSYGYGNPADPINNHFPAVSLTAPANTQSASLKFTVTGHGYDEQQCCEFMSHSYQVLENNNQVDQYTIWRDNCGFNEVSPQTGTWIYNRGNWCPGAIVYSNFHNLPNVTAGTAFTADVQFDPYTSTSGGGSYTTEGQVIYYGAFNNTLDASIEDIISPTTNENYWRENPLQGLPVIRVRNAGSSAITSISFQFGVVGNALQTYTWQGSLAPLHDTEITLPEVAAIRTLAGNNGLNTFTAQIMQVNNATDADATNNTMTSPFIAGPAWPVKFIVSMMTNSQDVSGADVTDQTGTSQTSWQIIDPFGNVVASRTNAATRTQYNDTVTLGPSFYKLVVTDQGCDGLHWWVYPNDPQDFPHYSSGTLVVKKTTGATIPLNNNYYSGTYNNDFGCGFTQYFATNWPAGVNNLAETNMSINAYPSPAQNTVTVNIEGIREVKGTFRIIDALGRTVSELPCNSAKQTINVANLANGIYTILFNDEHDAKLQTRLLIAK